MNEYPDEWLKIKAVNFLLGKKKELICSISSWWTEEGLMINGTIVL